jgi:hypothetical protein
LEDAPGALRRVVWFQRALQKQVDYLIRCGARAVSRTPMKVAEFGSDNFQTAKDRSLDQVQQ